MSAAARPGLLRAVLAHGSVQVGGFILLVIALLGIFAPWISPLDPAFLDPTIRNRLPGFESTVLQPDGTLLTVTHWLGTDQLGRDLFTRVLYGARVSLIVGLTVAVIAVALGLVIGLIAGYVRWLDGAFMRVMDGLMAIPPILLALALVALWGAGLTTVIIAVAIPEVPRVVRLVRAVVLSVREEPYVEAAISLGTPTPLILTRHVLPNTVAPLIVQGTYVCASAILVEAILSFLGVGIPTDIPTWGNIMAEGRLLFRVFPHNILFPGVLLALTVLAVNMMGDGMRDTLDPKLARRV
ncbi:MAG: ABC transporter permease [Geminicoccaceae bacterium]|nr:MAG: ABC transporter permease [Geminicoccaceae bacterium]